MAPDDQPADAIPTVRRGLPEGEFQRRIDVLRALGCKCPLMGRAGYPMPLSRTADSEACPARHYLLE